MIARLALTLGAAIAVAPAAAQDIAPVAVDLAEGVVFIGEGGVELEQAADGTAVATFWRPLQHVRDRELLAGRMDCRAAAQRAPYRAALYELAQVHEAQIAQGRLEGLTEIDRRSQPGAILNRLDVVGRRTSPLRYEVHTYIAVRTGFDLLSIRQTCSFLRDGQIHRQAFLPFVDNHTSFVLALAPPAMPDPIGVPTLDSITDIQN